VPCAASVPDEAADQKGYGSDLDDALVCFNCEQDIQLIAQRL
jgi:hypothetical protein